MRKQRDVESIAIMCRRVADGENIVPGSRRVCILCNAPIWLSHLMQLMMKEQLNNGSAKTICAQCESTTPDRWPEDDGVGKLN